jgi:nitrate reductase gamma subunit
MEYWLDLARGPIFLFSFGFMLLGLLRHALITAWEIGKTYLQASDRDLPVRSILVTTLKWLMPVGRLKTEPLFSITSIVFHIAILTVPVFLAGHIALWQRGTGFSWPAMSNQLADILTVVAVVSGLALVIQRLSARATRSLSRFQDYFLPVLITVPFLSGFLMMHPNYNPFSFNLTFLIHILSANLIFLLIPTTKLSHAVLIPSGQLVSELGWHWPRDAGSRVGVALGKENAPV